MIKVSVMTAGGGGGDQGSCPLVAPATVGSEQLTLMRSLTLVPCHHIHDCISIDR